MTLFLPKAVCVRRLFSVSVVRSYMLLFGPVIFHGLGGLCIGDEFVEGVASDPLCDRLALLAEKLRSLWSLFSIP